MHINFGYFITKHGDSNRLASIFYAFGVEVIAGEILNFTGFLMQYNIARLANADSRNQT